MLNPACRQIGNGAPMLEYTRRQWLAAGAAVTAPAPAFVRPPGVLVDTHIHLFAADQARFPYHPNAPYKPEAEPLERYSEFVRQAKIDHSVIVHPEPYQDDHRYLEYCFENEPWTGFFKGTCLYDPIAPETPARMEAIVKKYAGRIVAMRIHQYRDCKLPPTASGGIFSRDMRSPAMLAVWRKAHSLGIAIQMHFLPCHAPEIAALAAQVREMPVVLDHLGRIWMGTPMDYEQVLRLADLPRVFIKYSALPEAPDLQPVVRRVFQAFGADRIIWGGLGMSMDQFRKSAARFDEMFSFASEADRAKIRGLNAARLYRF